jgi:hypothetical protein
VKEPDKRQEPRHQGKLPVELETGQGVTRNFSSSGIFFETDRSFSTGQIIDFTLILEHVDPASPVRLKCRGTIVRVEEIGQKIGVAAAIDSYTFKEIEE